MIQSPTDLDFQFLQFNRSKGAFGALASEDVVTGLGLIGLVTVQLLRAHGCRVLGLDFSPATALLISTGYSWQASNYGAPDLFFGLTREDRVVGIDLSAVYQFTRAWSLRAELLAQETKSNIDLFSYRRLSAALNLRYSF